MAGSTVCAIASELGAAGRMPPIDSEAKKYFKYLHLVREDIREEFERLEIRPGASRVCDFGCGSGISTFGLALEIAGAECYGVDLFQEALTPETLAQYVSVVRRLCASSQLREKPFPGDLCRLVLEDRLPRFAWGDIVGNQNLPADIDLAYCKKLLANLLGKEPRDAWVKAERLRTGLEHIAGCMRPGGLLCAIEYDRDFGLGTYLEEAGLGILRRIQIQRREIRSRGRTNVLSTFALYLCEKGE